MPPPAGQARPAKRVRPEPAAAPVPAAQQRQPQQPTQQPLPPPAAARGAAAPGTPAATAAPQLPVPEAAAVLSVQLGTETSIIAGESAPQCRRLRTSPLSEVAIVTGTRHTCKHLPTETFSHPSSTAGICTLLLYIEVRYTNLRFE